MNKSMSKSQFAVFVSISSLKVDLMGKMAVKAIKLLECCLNGQTYRLVGRRGRKKERERDRERERGRDRDE